MTKAAALFSFWSGFGLTAYEENSLPKSPEFPYITYQLITSGDLDHVTGSASVWYRDASVVGVNAKVEEISQGIGDRVTLPCDGGAIIVRKGTPFSQPMGDDLDNMIKRRILTVDYLFATKY